MSTRVPHAIAIVLAAFILILAGRGQVEAQGPCGADEYTYTVTSYCPYPVWVGQHSPGPQSYPPVGGNWALAPNCTASAQCGAGQLCVIPGGHTQWQCACDSNNDCPGAALCANGLCSTGAVFCMPRTWVSGTFWPRTGCVLDGAGNLTCQTGQCGAPGKVDCGFGDNGATVQNPASKFEVTTGPGTGNYDVSLNASELPSPSTRDCLGWAVCGQRLV